jgi:hypothetical protein
MLILPPIRPSLLDIAIYAATPAEDIRCAKQHPM